TAYFRTIGKLLPECWSGFDRNTGPLMSVSSRRTHHVAIREYGKQLPISCIVSRQVTEDSTDKDRPTLTVKDFEFVIDHGVGRVHRDVVSFLSQQLDYHILAVSEQYRRIVSLNP